MAIHNTGISNFNDFFYDPYVESVNKLSIYQSV